MINIDNLIHKIQLLNNVLRVSSTTNFHIDNLCTQLSTILEANIFVFHDCGTIFSYAIDANLFCTHNEKALSVASLPTDYFKEYINSSETLFNHYSQNPDCSCEWVARCIYPDRYYSIVPIYINYKKVAGILLVRYGKEFSKEEEIICEYASTIISMELIRIKKDQEDERVRCIISANNAINSLSYAEKNAAHNLLNAMTELEEVILLGDVCKKTFVTRSSLSSTLKKLEGAGVIQVKSLGVRGTLIKILNPSIKEQINTLVIK